MKRNRDDMQFPYFRGVVDYGFGQYGLGSYIYEYSTMRVILFIPDNEKEETPFPLFPIKHQKYPIIKNSKH